MPAKVKIVGPGEGEQLISGANAMRIIEDGAGTHHRLGVGVITMDPQTAGPPPHWHAKHDEGFYVVGGRPRFTDHDGVAHDAPAGTWIMVPSGAAHTFANPGNEQAVILNTFTPDLYVGYFRDARALMDAGEPLTPEAMAAIRERYWTYPAGQQPADARGSDMDDENHERLSK